MNRLLTRSIILLPLLIIWYILNYPANITISLVIVSLIAIVMSLMGLFSGAIKFNLKAISYFLWLLKEILLSSANVIRAIWRYKLNIAPEARWIDATFNDDIGIVAYGNSITLTPGTLVIDTDSSNKKILVHALEKASLEDLEAGSMKNKIQNIIC